MPPSIAFVGAGPTTIYTLKSLFEHSDAWARIVIFEREARAGLGTPYRPGWNDPAMLSNIASVEIPPLRETLVDWMRRQPEERLTDFGIDPQQIDDRAFYPRLVLGRYFLDQFEMIVAEASANGFDVDVRIHHEALDMSADAAGGIRVAFEDGRGVRRDELFDYVVMATGHQSPEESEASPGYFVSPWPASSLKRIAAADIGIRGSSLTAIDAVVAIATAHGTFAERADEQVDYRPDEGSEGLRLTLMSRKGLLPEADFYHPIPYKPLRYCTAEAMEALIAGHPNDLLASAFELFRKELLHADPDYAAHLKLADIALEDFADRFFADRAEADPFEWAAANLGEAKANFEAEGTVPWRYAILRMHEVLALIAPHLDEDQLKSFGRYLKPVFVDEYATVPHLSIQRLLALHRAGCLDVLGVGDDYKIETNSSARGATVIANGIPRHFDAFVDATGQRPLDADDFPFPMLLDQGIVRDAEQAAEGGSKGISVDDVFHPRSSHPASKRLFCLSIPFVLGRHPFVQGITSSHEMGGIVGKELTTLIGAHRSPDEKAVAA